MEYVRVESGCIIDGPRTLPEKDGAIAGLHTLSRSDLAVLGWLPVVDVVCSVEKNHRQEYGRPFLAVRKTHVVRYCYSYRDEAHSPVSRRQLYAALDLLRLLTKAEALMVHADTDARVRSEWISAQLFYRHSIVMLGLGAGLGLTENELDRLFALAMQC